ncbi:MAG: hypothetical protein H0U80_06005 [Solirubrobacterales bacterium]|nr:hypothetical protein [Solirubrobacterales bacterium]
MATNAGQSAPEQAKEKVQEAASGASEQARSRVTDVVDQRSTDAGQQVEKTAQALRKTSSQLTDQGLGAPAKVLDAVVDRIEGAGSYLQASDGDRILHDVENFARRQPNAVIFGGLTLGFIASRLLKASSSRRYQSSAGTGSYGAAGYGTRTPGLPRAGTTAGSGAAAGAGVGALSGSPTSGLTAEGGSTSAPTSRMGLGNVGGEGEGFIPPRGA